MGFDMQVVDCKRLKDASWQFALTERLKKDKVDFALTQAHKFLSKYAANSPDDLSINLVDGNVGEGTVNGNVIELQLPSREQAVVKMREFIEPLFNKTQDEDERNKVSGELVIALTASTALHEGVHGILNSKPDLKFSSDLEAVTGFPNEFGHTSTLLDEGIAYAIQGIYAPVVEPIGSLAPVARETDEREVRQRKVLGEKLKPVVQEYLDEGKSIDADFFKIAKQSIIEVQTSNAEGA